MDQVRFKLDGDRFGGGSQGRCRGGAFNGGKRLVISALAAVAMGLQIFAGLLKLVHRGL